MLYRLKAASLLQVFHFRPQILNWVQIWAIAWPIQGHHIVIPQKFFYNLGTVAWSTISCIKIEVLWTGICNKGLLLSKSTYLDPFMVVPGVKKYNPAVPFLLMAPHIIWLGGCFMVAEVYFSSNRFPTGLQTCLCRTTNCWKVDSSLNKTFPQSSAVQ